MADGSQRWQFELDRGDIFLRNTIVDDTIYAVDGESLVAISAHSGIENWRFHADNELQGRPIIDEGTVYVTDSMTLYSLSAKNGMVRWRVPIDSGQGALVGPILENVVVFDDREGSMHAVSTNDGTTQWTFDYGGQAAWRPQLAGDNVILGTQTGTVYGLSSPPETAINQLRQKTATADTATLGSLLVGGIIGGSLLAARVHRLRSSDTLSETTTWNDFELRGLLYGGSTTEVYEACTPDGEIVALKQFVGGHLSASKFTNVTKSWADLNVPGVLEVRMWGTDPAPWIATEPVDATLADRTDDFAPEELAQIVANIAETVHRANREGVTHGQLKPESIWFVGEEVRVGDWRLAAELHGSASDSDTTQLAAMADDLLGEGRRTPELDDVLARALADDPADRYDSALKFADALRWAVRES
jgi:hypothetical protein